MAITPQRIEQRLWQPGLDNDERMLSEVYRSMPKDPASSVPWYVTALENPASPVALGGAVDLFGHDCIHILLGRGLSQRDEAFVVGFSMGASGSCTPLQRRLFRLAARYLYRGAYRFSALDDQVFAFAFQAGATSGASPLDRIDFHACFDWKLGAIRHALGVELPFLRASYAAERERWPTDAEARLLPTQALSLRQSANARSKL